VVDARWAILDWPQCWVALTAQPKDKCKGMDASGWTAGMPT